METPIIDGHNDVLLRLWLKKDESAAQKFVHGLVGGHLDMPRMRQGKMVGGFFAVFAPTPDEHSDDDDLNPPMAGRIGHKQALVATQGMLDLRDAIVAEAAGAVALCATAEDLRTAIAGNKLAWITHIEGAEALGDDLSSFDTLYARGLRSVGLVWSRANAFGTGVPFRFPSSPDLGQGLTEQGRALVRACNAKHVMIDLSHLNEKGFWDVAEITDSPLVATHSNAHAISASSRNLTDGQLRAIGASGGMVGLNYATGFLRDDGRWTTSTAPEVMIRHLKHMLTLAGEDSVGLGSDFDGARIPDFIGDAAGLPNLVSAMRQAGFGDQLIDKICHKNWLRVLEKTWGR